MLISARNQTVCLSFVAMISNDRKTIIVWYFTNVFFISAGSNPLARTFLSPGISAARRWVICFQQTQRSRLPKRSWSKMRGRTRLNWFRIVQIQSFMLRYDPNIIKWTIVINTRKIIFLLILPYNVRISFTKPLYLNWKKIVKIHDWHGGRRWSDVKINFDKDPDLLMIYLSII